MCVCVRTEKFAAKQFAESEMSGDWRNPVVPVDVVSWIVQQLSEVSQHTKLATTAMRHVVAEFTQLQKMRAMDTTTMVEALSAAGTRSVSSGAADNWVGRTTDPALRKL